MTSVAVSVIIAAHNPNRSRLQETLGGLRRQTLPSHLWETLVVDNASTHFPNPQELSAWGPNNLRVVHQPSLGLTPARLAGIRCAAGGLVVMVDDDNVLAPGYLVEVVDIFRREPSLGAAGGKSKAVFETPPSPLLAEFLPLLAIRDLGDSEVIAASFRPDRAVHNEYPRCAPIGAGMALRREAAVAWADQIEHDPKRRRLDRTGHTLVSGGDNDIVMTVLEKGHSVGYFPSLSLDHLIPSSRLDPKYLARLNRAIMRSWVQVLAMHGANPWPQLGRWTVFPRQAKAFLRLRAWQSSAHYIRWQGICGQLEGQASG
jgi:glycosyltransferase involved in cell wall biosynthesis